MITWNTETNLGTITTNDVVNIILSTTSTLSPIEKIFYTVVSGNLPPGLTLNINGIISGRVLQENAQLTAENSSQLIEFTIKAQGITSLEYSEKKFEITVNLISYKNIIAKAFLNSNQRNKWNDFINNDTIFEPKYIHNFENNQFGVNRQLEILIMAGIEEEIADKYISAIGLNHKRKQLRFGKIETAQGFVEGQRIPEYEVIYVKIYDPLDYDNKILPKRIITHFNQQEYITADHDSTIFYTRDITELSMPMPVFNKRLPNVNIDTTGYFASDPNPSVYFPSSISTWRRQIFEWREDSDIDLENDGFYIERNYLPLWMRSIQFQNNQYQELGYIPALVLCYCNPGSSSKIIKNIENYMKNTGFNFNQFDFTVDRFQIDNNFIFNTNANTL